MVPRLFLYGSTPVKMMLKCDSLGSLAVAGVPIFPLRPNRKVPAVLDWKNFATPNFERISELSKHYPDCNYGAVMGSFSGGFLMAIDLDRKNGRDGVHFFESEFRLPATRIHMTPTGGKHYIFKSDKVFGNRSPWTNHGVDVRGLGGYVVVPPSKIDGIAYEVLNDAPIATLPNEVEQALGASRPIGRPRAHASLVGLDQVLDIERGIRFLRGCRPLARGERNTRLYKIACRLGDFGISEQTALKLVNEYLVFE